MYTVLNFNDLILNILSVTYQKIIQNKILCLLFVLIIEHLLPLHFIVETG